MRKAFTLVEMLVVIGIIAVLVALLVPAAGMAVSRTRNFNMTAEISQLATAIERYKNEKGDYPPSMGEDYTTGNRYNTVAEKHLRKCYPKMTSAAKDYFYDNIAPLLTGDEALVFWLSLTQNDERNPFTSTAKNFKQFYDFKADRLFDPDGDSFPSYKAAYAGETAYVYLDSRTYLLHQYASTAPGGVVQAYGHSGRAAEILAMNDPASPQYVALPPANPERQQEIDRRKRYQYMNQTTFQILCAGQDREFGAAADQFDTISNATGLRQFIQGIGYSDEDEDNLANFSEGRRLADHIP